MLLLLEPRQLDRVRIGGDLEARLRGRHLGGPLVGGDLGDALAGRRRRGVDTSTGTGFRVGPREGAPVAPVDEQAGEHGEDAEHGDEDADEDGRGGVGGA